MVHAAYYDKIPLYKSDCVFQWPILNATYPEFAGLTRVVGILGSIGLQREDLRAYTWSDSCDVVDSDSDAGVAAVSQHLQGMPPWLLIALVVWLSLY